jgi:hypothetical protein
MFLLAKPKSGGAPPMIPPIWWLLTVTAGSMVAAGALHYFSTRRQSPQVAPNVKTVDVRIVLDEEADYPLKVRTIHRNDSAQCIDVRVSEWVPRSVSIKRPFPVEVLQVKLRSEWSPKDCGTDRIAVHPGQLFQAWIGPDERFTREQLEGLRKKMGTLVLLVNDRATNIDL